MSIDPKEKDNLLRWDGEKRGFYEVYYLKWNHAQSHEISSDLDRFVGVTYQDPDGQPLWCNNTKIASIRLRLFHSDDRPISELTSKDGCAFELVDRKIYPEVPIQI